MRVLRNVALLTAGVTLLFSVGAAADTLYGSATNEQGVTTKNASGQQTTTFRAGDIINVSCTAPIGFVCGDVGATATISFSQSPPVVLGVVIVDVNGRYDTTPLGMRIPSTATNGSATTSVLTRLNAVPVTYSRGITITGGATPGGLPVTGRNLALLAFWSLTMIVGGSVLVSTTWREWQAARLNRVPPHDPRLPALSGPAFDDVVPARVRASEPVAEPEPALATTVVGPSPLVAKVLEEVGGWNRPR